jgi:chorismate synthase
MSSTCGDKVKISIFGESHGKGVGVVIDGLPPGERIDFDEILFEMARRAPGLDSAVSARRESDRPEIISGVFEGKTTGAPLCAVIENQNADSSAYAELKRFPRPGHADYTVILRYGGHNDFRGGGHFSGRLTAPMVFAGAVCRQILRRKGV